MTDRWIGGKGVTVDLRPLTDQRLGGLGVQVDLVPPQAGLRIAGALWVQADVVSSVGPPVGSVLWSSTVFETGTASPPVYWSSGAFQSTGTSYIIWNTDHFEEAP